MKDRKDRKEVATKKAGHDVYLRSIPEDIMQMILKEQARVKLKNNIFQYSIGAAVINLLREYKRCKEETKFEP